jgi:hypothetical protein
MDRRLGSPTAVLPQSSITSMFASGGDRTAGSPIQRGLEKCEEHLPHAELMAGTVHMFTYITPFIVCLTLKI